MNKIEKDKLYQSKYEYYKHVCLYTVILSVLASTTYWISDCQLFDRIAWETLIPRLFMLLPLVIYLILHRKINNYKILILLSYVMIHGIMWCTIWAIYYLPIKQHANEGFIIMHLMFVALGMCAPIRYSIIMHSLLIIDIIVSYPINHYESISLMMTLGIPALVAVESILYILEKAYTDQYKANNKIEYLMIHDQLTGAYNRNKISSMLLKNTNILDYKEAGILLLDVDNFKSINDTYGHSVGDTVLKLIVTTIKSCIREDDLVIRWGGEEFLVILKDCKEIDTLDVAERIRKNIENCNAAICRFTVSIGMTKYRCEDYLKLVKEADKALYKAKENGRNQVVKYVDTNESIHN